jgi:hypothetical protein
VQFARAADASLSRDGGPLRSDGRWVRVLPFAAIALMAVVLTLIPTGPADAEGAHIDAAVWSAMLFAVLVLAAILLPWDRFNPNLQVVIPFGYMVVVLLLRHAQGSGDAGYTILYILPIVWLALYSPTWQLITGFCIAAVFILAPPLVDGPLLGEQHYPAVDVALTVIVLLIIAFVGGALRLTTDAASIDVLTGLLIDRRYDPTATDALWPMPWYPIGYWFIVGCTTLASTIPTLLRPRSGENVTWRVDRSRE